MNALNVQVQEELRAAAVEAAARPDARAVVLYGGPKVFAAGADGAAVEMAGRYVDGAAVALRAAKAAIDGGLDTDLASGLRLESYLFASLFATEDRAIGMRSFIQNGPGKAKFVGR